MSWTDKHRSKRWTGGEKRSPIIRDMIYLDHPIGEGLDKVYDLGREALLTSQSILDLIRLHDKSHITITFDKEFLKKILHSHIESLA